MTSKLRSVVASLLLLSSVVYGGDLVNTAGASGIAIDGYDPVAFFTEKNAVHGNPAITATYQGATYLFANEKTRTLFNKNPEKYVPQFGGFCAYGIAVNALFPVDIDTWQIRDGKLYFNLNPEILKAFNADFQGNIEKAEVNWKTLVKKHEGAAR